jgi:hypothetical protein
MQPPPVEMGLLSQLVQHSDCGLIPILVPHAGTAAGVDVRDVAGTGFDDQVLHRRGREAHEERVVIVEGDAHGVEVGRCGPGGVRLADAGVAGEEELLGWIGRGAKAETMSSALGRLKGCLRVRRGTTLTFMNAP